MIITCFTFCRLQSARLVAGARPPTARAAKNNGNFFATVIASEHELGLARNEYMHGKMNARSIPGLKTIKVKRVILLLERKRRTGGPK